MSLYTCIRMLGDGNLCCNITSGASRFTSIVAFTLLSKYHISRQKHQEPLVELELLKDMPNTPCPPTRITGNLATCERSCGVGSIWLWGIIQSIQLFPKNGIPEDILSATEFINDKPVGYVRNIGLRNGLRNGHWTSNRLSLYIQIPHVSWLWLNMCT